MGGMALTSHLKSKAKESLLDVSEVNQEGMLPPSEGIQTLPYGRHPHRQPAAWAARVDRHLHSGAKISIWRSTFRLGDLNINFEGDPTKFKNKLCHC